MTSSSSVSLSSDHVETPTTTSTAANNDHEPWIYRGGAIGDVQKLLLASPTTFDMFMVRPPLPYPSRSFVIRPYTPDDRVSVLIFFVRLIYVLFVQTSLYDLAHSTFECAEELTYDDMSIYSIANVDLFGDW